MAGSSPNPEIGAARPIALIDLAAQQRLIRDRIDAAIRRVLDHGQYIMGPEVAELERRLAAFTGARHAISCASGTDALLIAMMAKGIGPGDAVLCPAFTYTATPETIALIGATPLFVDVDADTFNILPEDVAAGAAQARRLGLAPKAVIAVDLFGQPADYVRLNTAAEAEGLWLLADAAQSFGASAGSRKVGTFGLVTATSFFPAKPLGCYGDGGAIFTDDDDLADVMRSIRLHGKGGDKYDIVRIGVNGRLDTIQAAILIEKLAIFPGEVDARNAVAAAYGAALAGLGGLRVPPVPAGMRSVWAQYTLRFAGGRRDRVAGQMKARGIPTAVYYPRPLHHQPAYRHFPTVRPALAAAEALSDEVLSLPMHPYLLDREREAIVAAVRAAVDA